MPPKQPEIIVVSKIQDVKKAFFFAEEGAKIRGNIGYLIKPVEDNGNKNDHKYIVTLTKGKLEDLLMAVQKTPFLEFVGVVEDESESMDVDLSDL